MLERTQYSAIIANGYANFHIVGLSPLLTNNPEGMAAAKPRAKKGETVYDPEKEAEQALYRLESGACCIKGIALRSAIISAASAFKVKRFVTMKSILAHISITEELCPLIDPETGERITTHEIDRRRVIVGKAGVIRSRPRFNQWSLYFTVVFDRGLLDPETIPVVADVLNDAGNRFGIGDYRPECSGWFGRFSLRDYAVSEKNEF